ncbi:MAG: type II toxin-antitoxin system RelE/ParE family toxin [Anaerolineae bacterium]
MSNIAVKQKRHQEHKTKQKEQAKRKAKAYKKLVLAHRRQWDRARRARERRERREHAQRMQREFGFRVKVVRCFHQLRERGVSEKRAVELTLEKYRPRRLSLSVSPLGRRAISGVSLPKGSVRLCMPSMRFASRPFLILPHRHQASQEAVQRPMALSLGDLRVVYTVDKESRTIRIVAIGRRGDIY